jgi:hypothetical protein
MLSRLAAAILTCSLSLASVAHAEAMRAPLPAAEQALSSTAVRAALAARREHNIAAFRAYASAGVYPHNFVRPGPLNVWRDQEGHLCAAATMIDRDGKHELVRDIASSDNHIRLLDVTSGPMMSWMLTSGLTIEEIDRIQKPAPRPNPSALKPGWREQADATLAASYRETTQFLADHTAAGLDDATERLMATPELARQLLAGQI